MEIFVDFYIDIYCPKSMIGNGMEATATHETLTFKRVEFLFNNFRIYRQNDLNFWSCKLA